jgi:nicotinamide mononucleotide transporter
MPSLVKLFALTSPWELLAMALALLYVVLAIKKSLWCWLAAGISSAIYVALTIDWHLYMEAWLNVFYVVMAVYGYWQWRLGRGASSDMPVLHWSVHTHVLTIGIVVVLSVASGWWLTHHSDAARPYVDSFITWSSVATTWMVTRRIVENWLYWIAIDAVAAVLYFQQGRIATGVLFVIYVGIAIHGYRVWLTSIQEKVVVTHAAQ